jgi:hypothetical protein
MGSQMFNVMVQGENNNNREPSLGDEEQLRLIVSHPQIGYIK